MRALQRRQRKVVHIQPPPEFRFPLVQLVDPALDSIRRLPVFQPHLQLSLIHISMAIMDKPRRESTNGTR